MSLVKPVLGSVGALLLMMACSSSSDDSSNPGDGSDAGLLVDGAQIPKTATDGVKDGDETDVDCGGSSGTPCKPNAQCKAAGDCDSGVCTSGRCAAPTSTDGVKNGDESDIDCGGTTTSAPKCATDKLCKANTDCASDGCAYNGKCVAIRSCVGHHGGDTCGTSANAADQESCCTTIAGSPIDKYNVTAGRFRAFVERENGNLRGYITANPPPLAKWDPNWTQYLPTMMDNGGAGGEDVNYTGVYQELGPYHHFVPSEDMGKSMGSNEGCTVKNNGTRTYRLPDAVNTRFGDAQAYPQDILDEKPMNCVDAFMAAAFCVWDGGRLPTRAEWDAAWGADKYPWGETPNPAGYQIAFDSAAGPDAVLFPPDPPTAANLPPGQNVKRANYSYNWWVPATKVATDYSLFVAEPGRFPTGNGPQGHADLAGNVFNYQGISLRAGAAADSTGYYMQGSKSGSWQGHEIPYPKAIGPNDPQDAQHPLSDGYSVHAEYKYWALGIRCARD